MTVVDIAVPPERTVTGSWDEALMPLLVTPEEIAVSFI
jgi:hypothetical protein